MESFKVLVKDRDGILHTVEANDEYASLMEVLREQGFKIMATCGGSCNCATCHVLVLKEGEVHLPKAQDNEIDTLDTVPSAEPGLSRLACQIPIGEHLEGLSIAMTPENWPSD